MATSKSQRALLEKIFESSDGLAPYSLFGRLAWSPAILASELAKSERSGLISQNGGRYVLTELGVKSVLSERIQKSNSEPSMHSQASRSWITRPDKIGINMPYVPRLSSKR